MRRISTLLFGVLFLGSLVLAGYFYWQWKILKSNPIIASADENKTLLDKVGKLIVLPPDELPTIATVTDPSKLGDQAFFANAQVGYKVLVYSAAKKAILYDPVRDMIVEVGPVKITDEPAPGTVNDKTWTDVPPSTKN